jgi:hypothetical protein
MQEIVPIRTDLDLKTWKAERDDAKVDEAAERYGLKGPLGRLRGAMDGGKGSE